ncbi:hypothetical protein F5877DRAFT_84492 [Lentinula edodes]|nr:hypothetical protein F5877DRAFT_84492 [Lentinula edodes]
MSPNRIRYGNRWSFLLPYSVESAQLNGPVRPSNFKEGNPGVWDWEEPPKVKTSLTKKTHTYKGIRTLEYPYETRPLPESHSAGLSAGQNKFASCGLPMSPNHPVHFLLFIISSSWILFTFPHTYAVPMPNRPPPPYSEHSPSHPMSTSGLSEALNIPPPPSYSRDMVFRVLKDQKYAVPPSNSCLPAQKTDWPVSHLSAGLDDQVFELKDEVFIELAFLSPPPQRGHSPDPYKKRAEVIIKVLQQFDRSALSEVGALKRFSYLFDSGLLKGKPTIITRKFPGVPLQQTDAWIKNPGQRENLREQVRTKWQMYIMNSSILTLPISDLHWENFLVEMTKDGKVKEVHIFNFEYPLLQVNFLTPYTTRSELEAWFNAYWDYRVDSGHWESDLV